MLSHAELSIHCAYLCSVSLRNCTCLSRILHQSVICHLPCLLIWKFRFFRHILRKLITIRHANMSFRSAIHMEQRRSHWHDIWYIFRFLENLSWKFKFHSTLTGMTSTVHEHVCTVVIVSHWILLKIWNFSDKICRKFKIPILYSESVLRNLTFYEIIWKRAVQSDMS